MSIFIPFNPEVVVTAVPTIFLKTTAITQNINPIFKLWKHLHVFRRMPDIQHSGELLLWLLIL